MVVEALTPNVPLGTFDKRILSRLARLDHLEDKVMLVRPLIKCLASELWPWSV